MDYYEPVDQPEEKDLINVMKFLNMYSNVIRDPSTVWTKETKQELKQTLKVQILEIYASKGQNSMNLVEHFFYTVHKDYLIIDEIFITLYNQDPKWRIPNPPQFLLKALKTIEDLRVEAEGLRSKIACKEDEQRLNMLLRRLCEAMNSISHVIAYHGFEDVILYEENLTQIGHLLEDPLFKNEQSGDASLRSIVLDILNTLSNKLNGALKIIENVTIMKWIVVMIRCDLKEVSDLIHKMFKIFNNVSKYDNLKIPMINYGILVLLWEAVLKTERYTYESRVEVHEFLMKILKSLQVTHPIHQLVLFYFPANIQELLYSSIPSAEIVKILDEGYNTPTTMWSVLMRYEILMILDQECTIIQNKWENYKSNEIRIMESVIFWNEIVNKVMPKFPELAENLTIDHIFVKNFNSNVSFDSKTNPMYLIDEVSSRALKVYDE